MISCSPLFLISFFNLALSLPASSAYSGAANQIDLLVRISSGMVHAEGEVLGTDWVTVWIAFWVVRAEDSVATANRASDEGC